MELIQDLLPVGIGYVGSGFFLSLVSVAAIMVWRRLSPEKKALVREFIATWIKVRRR